MSANPRKEMFRTVLVTAADNGIRVDLFVSRGMGGVSRKRLGRIFDEKVVKVNGRPAVKGAILAEGDRVEFPAAPLPADSVIPDPEVKFDVVFENGRIAIVEKCAGTPTHPNRSDETGTLANGLVHRWPAIAGVGGKPLEPGLVHRLDNGTSGLMVVALTADAFTDLRRSFTTGAVRKEYLAVVEGLAPRSGVIDRPLAHDARNNRLMKVYEGVRDRCRGKTWPATTEFSLVSAHGGFSLVRLLIEGGIMHQIRVHMAFAGHPVAGDLLYGSAVKIGDGSAFLLHASRLAFIDPAAGESHDFRSGPPSRFGLFLTENG
jgi:23S rRNA pseudouridine1911/1915/1917 synthase